MTSTDAAARWSGAAVRRRASEADRYDRVNRHFAGRLLDAAGLRAVTDAFADRIGPDGVELDGATWLVTVTVA